MKSSEQIQEEFLRFFKERSISGGRFLLAVSGGLDSVVLCQLAHAAKMDFAIAHCNFHLREEESNRDENFVRKLAEDYRVPIFVKEFETEKQARVFGLSLQETARKLRYEWFEEVRSRGNFSFVLLAHHADDNIENLLMNFFRGTGLQGMTGMPAVNKKILRPLLNVRREEIFEFAKEQKLGWVDDSSNQSSKYTRNFFRNELLPAIAQVFPAVSANLLANMERFKDIQALYYHSVGKMKEELCEKKNGEVRLPIRKLKKHPYRSLVFEIIREYGFGEKQVGEVIKLMESESGRFIENDAYQIIRHGLWLIIAPKNADTATIAIERGIERVGFPGGRLQLHLGKAGSTRIDPSPDTAQLDSRHLEFPLVLRKWKAGDYFYPLGMRKKKKLARFFIDQKLSRNAKEAAWVLESNKKIIWVVGMRIDERFKITQGTREVLTCTVEIGNGK